MKASRGAVLGVLGIVAAGAFLIARTVDIPLLRLVAKPLPVLALAGLVFHSERDRYSAWVVGGLVLGALGDLLLELGDSTFLAGVAAFLVAHLCYIAAFMRRRPLPMWPRAIPLVIFGGLVFTALRPTLGGMTAPVAAYTAAICVMGWRALALLGRGDGRDTWFAAAGALAFIASDTILAFNRFSEPIAGAGYSIILLYWLGQLGIAASAWDHSRARG
ncbi:MAG TPA: lysoplasmalogenase [Nannocystaceae bacterium]|nr:lysoplasmalogenase [Nannocystaceae bacterium]